MLEHEPVARHDELGAWGIFKHQDVANAFRDEDSWSVARRLDGIPPEEERYSPKHTLVGTDRPEHTRLRRLVNPGFHPKVIDRLRSLADEVATELLEEAVPKGTFDLVSEFAYPLPQRMIADILGVPREDLSRFTELSEAAQGAGRYAGDTVESEEHRRQRHAAHDDLRGYFAGLFEERRKEPQDDLLTALVEAEVGGDRLSAEEMMKMAMLIFVAGQTTTLTLLSNMIIELARHPAEVQKLRDRPELIPTAVEEVLRFHPPAISISRRAVTDVTVRGQTIPAGDFALLWLQAGNLDPDAFPEPERFDVERFTKERSARNLAFAVGPHMCVGAPLARMEAEVALTRWLDATSDFELAEQGPLAWNDESLIVVGVKHLQVTVTPA